jgi:hypothetical protein
MSSEEGPATGGSIARKGKKISLRRSIKHGLFLPVD